jgi:hypothetical protein
MKDILVEDPGYPWGQDQASASSIKHGPGSVADILYRELGRRSRLIGRTCSGQEKPGS